MNKEVKLIRAEHWLINSPAFNELTWVPDFYEGFHYVEGVDANVTRIFVAHNPESGKFAVGEQGNAKLHGWYKDMGNLETAFWYWCFYPRYLEPA